MRSLKLRYTRRARRQLDAIHDYIAERNSEAAVRVVARIRETARLLTDFPSAGHIGAVPSSREFVVVGLPYVVVYRASLADSDTLEILAIFHAAQDRSTEESRR